MLILTLLASSFASTTSFDSVPYVSTTPNAKRNCLRHVKCPETEAPLCVRVERSLHQEPLYIMVLNQCETEYLKCYPSLTVTVVSMSACHFGNATQISQNDRAQNRIKRSAEEEDKISIIQYSSERQKKDDLKSLVEWSPSSLEEIENKIYFGFVVDVSRHMGDVLPQIRDSIEAVLKKVSQDDSKRIKDLVLTVYVWPKINGTIMTRTEDIDQFLVAVMDLECVSVNQDDSRCEQEVYQSSILALERAVYHTHMFVFSNGPPSEDDAHFEIEVRRLAQKKHIEVNFVVTGDCGAPEGEPFQSFYKVAAAAKGQVLRMDKEDLEKLANYVDYTAMEFDRRVLVSTVYPANGSSELTIPFEVTEKDDFVTVTVSGDECDFVVANDRDDNMDYSHDDVITKDVKTCKYIGLEPGLYQVRVHPNELVPGQHEDLSAVLVSVAVSSVEMLFKYGFSEHETSTLKNTEAQPGRDTSVFIIIAVREPKYWVSVTEVAILSMDDKVISTYSLVTTTQEDVYRTEHQIVIPKQKRMKIKVIGFLRGAKVYKTIERTSTRVFTPYKTKTTKAKTTTTTETEITTTEAEITSTEAETTSEEAETTTTETTTSDEPTTTMRRRTTTTTVDSADEETTPEGVPPKIDKTLDLQKCSENYEEGYFYCNLRCKIIAGQPEPEIEWTVRPPASEDGYPDNEETDMRSERLYWRFYAPYSDVDSIKTRYFVCRAYNNLGEDKFALMSYARNDDWLYGHAPGELDVEIVDPRWIPLKLRATEGDNVKINCRLTQVNRIKWSYKKTRGSRYRPLGEKRKTLLLDSVTTKDAGFYRCEPKNPKIKDKQVFVLEVEEHGGFDYSDYSSYEHSDYAKKRRKKLKAEWQVSSCPAQCPARDVLVCARCQHGVHRTFLSDCHMRMYQCRHPEHRMELVVRRPCAASAPFLGDMPRPIAHVA